MCDRHAFQFDVDKKIVGESRPTKLPAACQDMSMSGTGVFPRGGRDDGGSAVVPAKVVCMHERRLGRSGGSGCNRRSVQSVVDAALRVKGLAIQECVWGPLCRSGIRRQRPPSPA